MNMDFGDGMRAAMRLIQAQKLMQATRVIQSALSGREQPDAAGRAGWNLAGDRKPCHRSHGRGRGA